MATFPKVSIIITTWNTAKITLRCVTTIKKFLSPKTFQIIVVDNGSTDDTSTIFNQYHDIIYIKNKTNLGFSKGCNIGAQQATGKYLFFLNSDMELIDDSLLQMVSYLETHPEVAIIGPQFLNPDKTVQGSVLPNQTPLNAFKEFWLGFNSYSKYAPKVYTPIEVDNISGGALLISQKIFKYIHGWDERYFFYSEDLEMCRQVKKLSKKIIYFPQCRVIHRHGFSGKNLASNNNQWRRQIPSSKIFHGIFEHYLLFLIIWSSQKIFRNQH